jgi:hypothetical protein
LRPAPYCSTSELEYAPTVAEALVVTGNIGLLSNRLEPSRTLGVRDT